MSPVDPLSGDRPRAGTQSCAAGRRCSIRMFALRDGRIYGREGENGFHSGLRPPRCPTAPEIENGARVGKQATWRRRRAQQENQTLMTYGTSSLALAISRSVPSFSISANSRFVITESKDCQITPRFQPTAIACSMAAIKGGSKASSHSKQ